MANANPQIIKPASSNPESLELVLDAIINTGNARKDALAKP